MAAPVRILAALLAATPAYAEEGPAARPGGEAPAYAAEAPPARATEAPPGWQAAWDYLVQDVCVDGADQPVTGATPLDGPAACPRQRKLRTGERLPYHKWDWPGGNDRASYQQSDSIPIRSSLGPAVLQTYDFGDPPRAFGRLDEGDGGQVAFFTGETVAFGVTEDGGAGMQLFIGPGCVPADSWVVVGRGFATQPAGEALARITRNMDRCPAHLGYAYTRWRVQPVTYRTLTPVERDSGSPGRVELPTLVSEHFGGRSVEAAGHLERMQFTHALGYTRWERWENLAVHGGAADRTQAQAFAATGRCDAGLGAPAPGGWVLVDCRQWTVMAGPDDPAGDPPGPWLDRLRTHPMTRALFPP